MLPPLHTMLLYFAQLKEENNYETNHMPKDIIDYTWLCYAIDAQEIERMLREGIAVDMGALYEYFKTKK